MRVRGAAWPAVLLLAGCGGGNGGVRAPAPVAVDDVAVTSEDTAADIDVLANDEHAVFIVGFSEPASGTVAVTAAGTLSYLPDAEFSGTDAFTYTIRGKRDETATANVAITVNEVGDVPHALGDEYSTPEDEPLVVGDQNGVLGNDVDADSAVLSAVVVTQPSNGALALAADGSFTFTPDADFEGTSSFTYRASDGVLDSQVVTVAITVSGVNDAPVAAQDFLVTAEDAPLVIPAASGVLANDADVEGVLFALLSTGPAHGSLSLAGDGSLVYTPDADYAGSDGFAYRATDGILESPETSVTITIDAVNDAPIAAADDFAAIEDVPLAVPAPGVLANDGDVDSTITAQLVATPSNGLFSLDPDGSFDYEPDPEFHGTDSFTYRAVDGTAQSAVVTVTIDVASVDDDASAQIQDIRDAADGTGLALPIEGGLVTFVKPAVGAEPAGFFLQAAQQGPAIFVAVDAGVSVGDEVELLAETLTTVDGMRRITAISSLSVASSGNDVSALVQDVGAAADLVTDLDDYEAELVVLQGTTVSAFTPSGGYSAGTIATAALGSGVQLRAAPGVAIADECDVELGPTPLWRSAATPQPSAWSSDDLSLECVVHVAGRVMSQANPFNPGGNGVSAVWQYDSLTGLAAGDEMCAQVGLGNVSSQRVCTWEELERAAVLGHTTFLGDGMTFWVHRTTAVTVGMTTYLPGSGARCADWTATGSDLADGEWGVRVGDTLTFNFDPNPCFTGNPADGCAQAGTITCNDGAGGPLRAIPCCFQ